ncbi:MAG TPA: Na+/H+ antiporter subunit D [Xanthomonadaceae bacterium]|jgi:multicomponent Na+:H+ antiporter subunit D|nr:Na+/H+ antiporter subunit D [Xanthomonadaceae bacterium]
MSPGFAAMEALVAAPLLLPLAVGLLCGLLPRAWVRSASAIGAFVSLLAAVALLAVVMTQGTQDTAFGDWALPFAIQLVADPLGAAMAVVAALMGFASIVFQLSGVDAAEETPTLHPLLHLLLAAVAGAFLTGDLFNLYVWFELMLVAAVGLFIHQRGRLLQEAGFKYFIVNAFGTLVFLAAIAWVYARTGHLNFDALEVALAALPAHEQLALAATLALGFLLKAGAFPLFGWLPASYHVLPTPVLALFAGLLTKVGVYAILRVWGDVMPGLVPAANEALGWVAVATMVVGVLGAAFHWDMRRILAFHIISQIGYILLAIALGAGEGHAAATFYTIHHIIVKANLFLIAALMVRAGGDWDLRRAGGLWKTHPWLGLLFLVPALSLVGIPPLSGFWAKLLVVREAFAGGHAAWAAAALLVGFLTLYSMMKIWMEGFWKPAPGAADAKPSPHAGSPLPTRSAAPALPRMAVATCATLAAITVVIGLAPDGLFGIAQAAAAAMGAAP